MGLQADNGGPLTLIDEPPTGCWWEYGRRVGDPVMYRRAVTSGERAGVSPWEAFGDWLSTPPPSRD